MTESPVSFHILEAPAYIQREKAGVIQFKNEAWVSLLYFPQIEHLWGLSMTR